MSEQDPRAFAEYTTHATSFLLQIPVQIAQHELYKWIVEKNNDNQNIISIKKYAELTITFAKDHPEFFSGNEAQKMLQELKSFVSEITDNDSKKSVVAKSIVPMEFFNKPNFLQMPNTKLSNALFDATKNLTKMANIKVSEEKTKEEILIKAKLSFVPLDNMENIELPTRITAYDKAVHDAICSIYANGNMRMSSNQIYEAMTGKPTKNSQRLEKVDNSVMKLMMSLVYVNYTDQAKAWGLDCEETKFKANILYCKGITVKFSNGEEATGWQLIEPPTLYQYALETKQIVTVDKALLCTSKVKNSEDVIAIKHYLLRRIELMKNQKNSIKNPNILFSTLFSYCGIKGSRENLRKKRNIITELLQDWKNTGYIKDFSEYKGEKNKILGVTITLEEPKKIKL